MLKSSSEACHALLDPPDQGWKIGVMKEAGVIKKNNIGFGIDIREYIYIYSHVHCSYLYDSCIYIYICFCFLYHVYISILVFMLYLIYVCILFKYGTHVPPDQGMF